MIMARILAALAVCSIAACKPSASADYAVTEDAEPARTAPSMPIASPDTAKSAWARSADGARLLYGDSGAAPYFSLGCENGTLVFTRHAGADPGAKAMLALIGNGHVERLFVDAERQGAGWLWRGRLPADDPRLDVLTGGRRVEATVPGAGSLILNPSSAPGAFITACASASAPAPSRPANPA